MSAIFIFSVSPAHAQHHSGALAPPIDFDGMTVALSSILTPEYFTPGDSESANLSVRFFDSQTDTNIESVTYRIQIYHEDMLVASEYFYDEDGSLDLEIRPATGCKDKELWKCTSYFGEKHPIAGAYFARGDSRPVIEGPVFDIPGQYSIQASIVGATNPKTMTTSDLHFETSVIIPERQDFLVQTASAEEFPISIKSFGGKVKNIALDEKEKTISYDMPFVPTNGHSHDPKQVIYVQKGMPIFKQGHDIDIFVEGIRIDRPFVYDMSSPDQNVIRIEIPHDDVMRIHSMMGEGHSNQEAIRVDVSSGIQTQIDMLDFSFGNGYSAGISWNSQIRAGQEIPFAFAFFDDAGSPASDMLFAYSVTDSKGDKVWSDMGDDMSFLGIQARDGTHQEAITIPDAGSYQITVILTGQHGKNFEEFLTSKGTFDISASSHKIDSQAPLATAGTVQEGVTQAPNAHEDNTAKTTSDATKGTQEIPPWVKNGAGWWADGIVGDSEFIRSVEFLASEGIISVPPSRASQESSIGSQEIPGWVKNNAGWWADGQISDRDFMKGIEFLGEQGIIRVR